MRASAADIARPDVYGSSFWVTGPRLARRWSLAPHPTGRRRRSCKNRLLDNFLAGGVTHVPRQVRHGRHETRQTAREGQPQLVSCGAPLVVGLRRAEPVLCPLGSTRGATDASAHADERKSAPAQRIKGTPPRSQRVMALLTRVVPRWTRVPGRRWHRRCLVGTARFRPPGR